MAWGWSKTRYSPIAVDFGADSLKLLQIVPSEPPQMVAAAAIDLPESARLDPASRDAFFSQSLKELVASGSFKGRRAICSIPAYHTLVLHLQIARTDDQANVEEQIHQHLRERLNVDPARMVVRHFQVGQVIRDGTAKQEVICLAASHEVAMKYIQIAQRAKLNVVGMYSEPLAILKAFSHLYRRQSDVGRVSCFIDLGCATTKVVIAHGKDIAFAKTIHYAGEHFTRHMAKVADIGFSDARLARIQQATRQEVQTPSGKEADESLPAGVDDAPVAMTVSKTDPAMAPVSGLATMQGLAPPVDPVKSLRPQDLGESLDCLLDELMLCVRYHQSTFPEQKIDKLIFLGGESRHAWICQKIARTVRIGAQLGDPMARLVRVNQSDGSGGVNMRQPQPGWAVPLGLCLSEVNL